MVFGRYNDFEECDFCVDKYTTKCWFNLCKTYNIKHSIRKLNDYITTRIDLEDDIIMINEKYQQYLKKYSKINLVPNTILVKTDMLDDDILTVIISRKALNEYGRHWSECDESKKEEICKS